MSLRRKQRDGIDRTFDEGPDAVTLTARSVGRATYLAILEEHSDDDGKITDDDAYTRALLATLSLRLDGGDERPLTESEVDELVDSPDWSAGDIAGLIANVRVANEAPTGKVSTGSMSESNSSEPPATGD